MELFIGHKSALEYWRLTCAGSAAQKSKQGDKTGSPTPNKPLYRNITLPESPPDTSSLTPEGSWGLTLPLDIMLRNPSARRASQTTRQHVFRATLPTSSFVRATDDLKVSSPELCFLQMATELPLFKLIELAYELCGTYSLPANATEAALPYPNEKGFNTCLPLTSKKKLETFLNRMPGVKGRKNALRALRYVGDGSASPMETRLTMLLSLSFLLGGYGFPLPELNAHIIPAKTARRTASKTFYSCDLYWPEYDLAVEYDSDLFHTGPERIASDSMKRNALASVGIMVITVTNLQIRSTAEFEKTARLIATAMGRRLRLRNPGFATRHRELRNLLF